ncbi:MAG: hypothetical protein ACI4MS_01060 [Candidatus Coproplasma sp.]
MKKKIRNVLCVATLAVSMLCISACTINSDTPIWKIILIFCGIVAGMVALNSVLEFLAIKFAYIYWPICLGLTLFFFFMELKGNNFGSDLGIFYVHSVLLYLLIPNIDDSVKMYSKITYEYDLVFSEWRETDRKTIKEETPGFLIKLVVIAVLLVVFFLVPFWIFKDTDKQVYWMLFLPLGLEGLISLICSIMGIVRLIKYHG